MGDVKAPGEFSEGKHKAAFGAQSPRICILGNLIRGEFFSLLLRFATVALRHNLDTQQCVAASRATFITTDILNDLLSVINGFVLINLFQNMLK